MNKPVPASPAQISDEPNNNIDLCDCGHRREKHHHSRGLCEATAVNGHICVCSRFKYPKFDIKVEDAKLVVAARSRLEPVEAATLRDKMSDEEAVSKRLAFLSLSDEEKMSRCVFCGEEFVSPVCGHINCGGRLLDVKIPEPVEAVSTTPTDEKPDLPTPTGVMCACCGHESFKNGGPVLCDYCFLKRLQDSRHQCKPKVSTPLPQPIEEVCFCDGKGCEYCMPPRAKDGKLLPALPQQEEPAEHPRADCEGCNKPDCPCNARNYEGEAAIAYSDGFISGREAGYNFCGSCEHPWDCHDGECGHYEADGSICGCKKVISEFSAPIAPPLEQESPLSEEGRLRKVVGEWQKEAVSLRIALTQALTSLAAAQKELEGYKDVHRATSKAAHRSLGSALGLPTVVSDWVNRAKLAEASLSEAQKEINIECGNSMEWASRYEQLSESKAALEIKLAEARTRISEL